ncbi:hypothetical protein HanPSC8_Chr00c054g0803271 [Helianthus annuus]|nr:hypothetical protein HanPSC8_Chr00c054g0803271 [Helianthus annuus]
MPGKVLLQFREAIHIDVMKVKGPRQSLTALNNRLVYQAESRELFLLCLQLHLKATCKFYYDHPSLVVRRFHYQEVHPRLLVAIFPEILLILLV